MSDFSSASVKQFFDTILKGESVTYNDHNWYTNNGLNSYIQGRSSKRYPLLKKDLSELSIGEVMSLQNKPRNSNGQLFATGRYQIIPDTLKGITTRLQVPTSQKYDKKTQDQLGLGLLLGRSNAKKYLTQQVDDTKENLEKASLDVAKEWSSVGVPYAMKGANKYISKNQSYYAGGGDVASIKTEVVQQALKNLRKAYGTSDGGGTKGGKLGKILLFSSIGLILVGTGIFVYDKFFSKKK